MSAEYKAVPVGNTWGVGMGETMLVVGMTEGHARSMVRDLRQAQRELEAREVESDADDRQRSGYYGSR